MPTRMILRREEVNESNLGQIVKESGYHTLADEHSVLVARASNRDRLKNGLKMNEYLLGKFEKEDGVTLDKAYLVFIAERPVILRAGLKSPLLTKIGLTAKGIEPIARYAVRRDDKKVRLIRKY
jgi:hypothetical protein